jgi:hypothetical protein
MGRRSRAKGARIERAIVTLPHDAGVPASETSRTGYPGHDLTVAEHLKAEVKARSTGAGFKQLETCLGDANLWFLKWNRHPPFVLLQWDTCIALLTGGTGDHARRNP